MRHKQGLGTLVEEPLSGLVDAHMKDVLRAVFDKVDNAVHHAFHTTASLRTYYSIGNRQTL